MVTPENYEEYLMMQADGELSAQELAALQAFLDAHPELAAEAAAWQAVKLVPDEMVRYDHAETLLREKRKTVAFRPWHAAVPAAAALLLALFIIRNPNEAGHLPVALHTAPETPVTETTKTPEPPPAAGAMPVKHPPVPIKTLPGRRRAMLAMQAPSRPPAPATAPGRRAESLAGLDAQQAGAVTVASAGATAPVMLAMAEPLAAVPTAGAEKPGVSIQLAGANAEAISLIRSGLDERVEQLGRAAKAVRETAVVIKFGSNAFHINL